MLLGGAKLDLPATAPKLSIDVMTRLGSTRISTRDVGR